MCSSELLVPCSGFFPVIFNGRRVPLVVFCGIAKTVLEITRGCCGKGDACNRIIGYESISMIHHIKFPVNRVDYDQVLVLVIIEGVAVQPVAFDMIAADVQVDPAGSM